MIPHVGQKWHHERYPDNRYKRISDEEGKLSIQGLTDSFYSIDLDANHVVHTYLDANDIVIDTLDIDKDI
jgi:hypothetical protein